MVIKAIPESPAELEELLADPKALGEFMGSEENRKAFLANYATKFATADKGETEAQRLEQTSKVLEKLFEDHDAKMPEHLKRLALSPEAAGGPATGVNHSAYKGLDLSKKQMHQIAATGEGPGIAVKDFDHLGKFANYISTHLTGQTIDLSRMRSVGKALGEGQGDQGGFLVPEEFRAELMTLALENAVVRPLATVIPMSGPTFKVPTIRDTSHASSVFGGVTATWVPESGTIGQTEPTFSQVVLTALKLTGSTRVANELIRDSAIGIQPLINTLFSEAIRYFEDDAFLNGIGGAQPVGILNADALVTVAKEVGQTASTFVFENVVKMFSRMLPESMSRAVWVMNSTVMPELYGLSLNVGTGGSAMFIANGGIGGTPGSTLLGRPIIFTEKTQALGTAGDIRLVDFSHYLIGDRQSIELAVSEHSRFLTDETEFRLIQRVDGRPWLDSALTPKNGDTLSPFVQLATRA